MKSSNFLASPKSAGKRKLIINSGDISDADGFYAIAKYAKDTDADVLFIMNYPGYMQMQGIENGVQSQGLGYRYDTGTYLRAQERDWPLAENPRDHMKRALDMITISIISKVWDEQPNPRKGRLYFCSGGINDINPFSADKLKNEVLVYGEMVDAAKFAEEPSLDFHQNRILQCSSGEMSMLSIDDFMEGRSEVYVDFNGSMAWLDGEWCYQLTRLARGSIKCAVVQGGVLAALPPETMPAIDCVLNRLSCATMNQLYSPSKTSLFFRLMRLLEVPVYMVSNDSTKDCKTTEAVYAFLESAGIFTPTVRQCAALYYNSAYNPPKKPFDFYSANALASLLNGASLEASPLTLHFDSKYGTVLLDASEDWDAVVDTYAKSVRLCERYARGQKNYESELEILKALPGTYRDKMQVLHVPEPGIQRLEWEAVGCKSWGLAAACRARSKAVAERPFKVHVIVRRCFDSSFEMFFVFRKSLWKVVEIEGALSAHELDLMWLRGDQVLTVLPIDPDTIVVVSIVFISSHGAPYTLKHKMCLASELLA